MQVTVIGTGYVGLVVGTCLASMGREVILLDSDHSRIDILKQGKLPFYELGLEAVFNSSRANAHLSFTSQPEEAFRSVPIIVIAVGTPSIADGSVDLTQLMNAAATIARHMESYKLIIIKSTVPVGTAEIVRTRISSILSDRKIDVDFDVVSNPEFLREGNAINDFMQPDRIVAGVDNEKSKLMISQLYRPITELGHPVLFMDHASAEMTKYASNAFLATKISLINEIAILCEKLNANIEQVRLGIGADKRIGYYHLGAGVGYGGSCFPKDISALIYAASQFDERMHILESVRHVNANQIVLFIRKIHDFFSSGIVGKKIAIWGVAFKADTDDIRESPSIVLIQSLLDSGAILSIYDPAANENTQSHFRKHPLFSNLIFGSSPYDTLNETEALCLLTDWDEFKNPDFKEIKTIMKTPVIFDGRNLYAHKELLVHGFSYFRMGSNNTECL